MVGYAPTALYSIESRGKHMNDLVVKSVDLFGDSIMAAKDKNGNIWAGVSFFCKALGMSNKQRDTQVEKVQTDRTLRRGTRKFPGGVFDPNNEVVSIKIDFIPLWLAKISITDKMEKDHPELADKLLQYQLKAKDVLAAAFLPQKDIVPIPVCNPLEIPLGELASYLKAMDRVAHRENLAPHKIAENFKKVSAQFGVELTDDFVNEPEFEQLSIANMLKESA